MIVIGVGNEFRRDDGAGPAVIAELAARSLDGVTLAVSDGEPTHLIDLWSGADHAAVIDTVRSEPSEPGRIREFGSIAEARPGTSSHALGFGVAVRLGEALGRLPGTLRMYLIDGADFALGSGLCPPVERAVAEVADRVAALARRSSAAGPP